MSDEENGKRRPNANYNLTKQENGYSIYGEDKLKFHYNRERRLEKAPQIVKDMYKGDNKPGRFGFFKSLVSDRPRSMLFFSIVILCAIIFMLSVLGRLDSAYTLDGNTLEISAVIYEDNTIVVLQKNVNKNKTDFYTGAVDIAVSPKARETEMDDFPVFYHRLYFSFEEEQVFRFAVPFDEPVLLMVIQTERNSVSLELKTR
jgi:hypothetical protein